MIFTPLSPSLFFLHQIPPKKLVNNKLRDNFVRIRIQKCAYQEIDAENLGERINQEREREPQIKALRATGHRKSLPKIQGKGRDAFRAFYWLNKVFRSLFCDLAIPNVRFTGR